MRSERLACNNLLAVDLITAAEEHLILGPISHAELFWAVRREVAATSASSPPAPSDSILWIGAP